MDQETFGLLVPREQLAAEVAIFNSSPAHPLNMSPWVAMSLLQKAIRRGRVDLAHRAAATLLHHSPERLWRRLVCVAFEDVGLADVESVTLVTAAMAGKRARAAWGGEWPVASYLISRMAGATKCRAADDLLMAAEAHPSVQNFRLQFAFSSIDELARAVVGDKPLPIRAVAAWLLLGTDRRPSRHLSYRQGSPPVLFEALRAIIPPPLLEITREGVKRSSEILPVFMAMLWPARQQLTAITADDELPPEVMIGDVPGWAFDIYTRPGRTVFTNFIEGSTETARWIRGHIPPRQRVTFLGGIVFRLEGGCVKSRLRWQLADELKGMVDIECAGCHCPDATEGLHLMKADVPALNQLRKSCWRASTMSDQALTPDNHHLSRATISFCPPEVPNLQSISSGLLHEKVAKLVSESLSENSHRAYLSDLREFERWGGSIPTSPELVASYLAAQADRVAVATLVRHLASISKAHQARGLSSPTQAELVRATLRGIRRTRGCAQKQAQPLLRDELLMVLDATGSSMKDLRDRALLLIGFAGALRRSELVGLDVQDVEQVRQGIIIHLRRSKTDREGQGRKIGIPFGRGRWCPVAALDEWLSASGIADGPIFHPIDRHGHVQPTRLSGEAVSTVLRERAEAAGLSPAAYSGHSLRAGFATVPPRPG